MTAIILSFVKLLQIATPFVFILAIIWIRGNRRRDRWDWAGRRSRQDESTTLSQQEQAALNDLVRIAEKMEQRLMTLEKIIEVDDPHWKERL